MSRVTALTTPRSAPDTDKKEYGAAYRKTNKEIIKQRKAAYYKKNKEAISQQLAIYRKKDVTRQRNATYHENNKKSKRYYCELCDIACVSKRNLKTISIL